MQKSSTVQAIWSHGSHVDPTLTEAIVAFCAGRDVEPVPPCDQALLTADIATNQASLLALIRAGVLTREEGKKLALVLLDLSDKVNQGQFKVDPQYEDVHINIEKYLHNHVGELAGRIHSGRSRNDQVACDIRLYHRQNLLAVLQDLLALIQVLVKQAGQHRSTLLPGYSHHQRAFLTTWGHLLASYAQALLRDVERGLELYQRINRCPLGAAAGFGTSWNLDRNYLAKVLGFDGLLENSLDAVSSRVEVETEVAGWMSLWMNHASLIAQDLILFSMEEFRFVQLAVETTTGSSIMPQKRNPDFAEVIKGKASLVHGGLVSLLCMAKGQPSGYHRDSQYSKSVGQDLWRETQAVPVILQKVFLSLKLDKMRMKEALKGGFLEAAEWADRISRESGLPFRDLYTAVGRAVDRCRSAGRLMREILQEELDRMGIPFQIPQIYDKEMNDPGFLISQRRTAGSPNPVHVNDHLSHLGKLIRQYGRELKQRTSALQRAEQNRLKELTK